MELLLVLLSVVHLVLLRLLHLHQELLVFLVQDAAFVPRVTAIRRYVGNVELLGYRCELHRVYLYIDGVGQLEDLSGGNDRREGVG